MLQHVMWTRMVVLESYMIFLNYNSPHKDYFCNATDFGNALVPFYGEEAAMTFENLFSQHITLAAELVGAAKAGDSEQVDAIWQRWLDNANQIAEFLVGINPNWMLEDWNAMLQEHLSYLLIT